MPVAQSRRDYVAMIVVGGLGFTGALSLGLVVSYQALVWVAFGSLTGTVGALLAVFHVEKNWAKVVAIGLLLLALCAPIKDSINGTAYLFAFIGTTTFLHGIWRSKKS